MFLIQQSSIHAKYDSLQTKPLRLMSAVPLRNKDTFKVPQIEKEEEDIEDLRASSISKSDNSNLG